MKTRKLLRNFIWMLLMVAIILPMVQPVTAYAKRKQHSIGRPDDLEHPSNWLDYSDEKVEAEFLAEQQEAGSKDDFNVNYHTIREMVLNDEYDSEILSKKYRMLDEFYRYYAQFDNSRPFFDVESKTIVKKVGIVDKIWNLDDDSVVFTLTDNPTKRFLIMPGYDYFHFRYVTQPGDKVHLLTTTDRIVYEFDNYNLTRGHEVNYWGYMDYRHPEDMVIDGFFPSKLYQERLEKADIPLESWLQLMLEYVDVEEEQYYGYANYIEFFDINPDRIYTADEYYEMQTVFDSLGEEMRYDNYFYQNSRIRRNTHGFDYDSVDEFLLFTYGEIREIKTNSNGETVFTLWEEPTRWYYMSKYYDLLHLGDITKPGDEVYIIYTSDKIVYGFQNDSIFDESIAINNPFFYNKDYTAKAETLSDWGVSVTEFWQRVSELPKEKQQKYEKLDFPKEIED